MFKAIAFLLVFQVSNAFAQYYPVSYCYLDVNPHSYACLSWVFGGSPLFPLNVIDLKNEINGEWKTITYSNPWSENNGPEFVMMVKATNNRIPVGVVNKDDNTFMGSLNFDGQKVTWTNWRGKTLKTKMDDYAVTDSYTFRFSFKDGNLFEQSFICRDFNRNNRHHLVCSWYLIRWNNIYQTAYSYEHRGYFGFIKPSDSEVPVPAPYPNPIPVNPQPEPPVPPVTSAVF